VKPFGYWHCGPAIDTVTTPPLAVNVEPGGSGAFAELRVTLSFGVALEAPPLYFSVVRHPLWTDPTQVAVVVVNAICRNTKIDVGTPAAAPAESSTRTTNENVPTAVGVPVALPFEDNTTPAGSAPDEIDHLYGLTPPAATTVTVP
jgi:hypothetical protein